MISLGAKSFGTIRTQIVDKKSGRVVKDSGPINNLIFDATLNSLAAGNVLNFSSIFLTCKTGSSNSAQKIASGGITFTQVGTTITASASFFTSGMTGAILKYGATGSGGAEVYITFVNATTATSSISLTVATPAAGTVWLVNQTALSAYNFKSRTYQIAAGSCGTSYAQPTLSLFRTYIFEAQVSSYNVNEIGYSQNNTNDGSCNGRVVLPSTDTVAPTQFYRVFIQMNFSSVIAAPVAVADIGSGFNTAGTVMMQCFNSSQVLTTGAADTKGGLMDYTHPSGNTIAFAFRTANDITLNSTVGGYSTTSINDVNNREVALPNFTNSGQPVGVGVFASNVSYSFTTAGQTCYSLILSGQTNGANFLVPEFVLLLTTPVVLPSGTFAGSFNFKTTYSRTLVN